jgi:hypothetical protein
VSMIAAGMGRKQPLQPAPQNTIGVRPEHKMESECDTLLFESIIKCTHLPRISVERRKT